MNAAPWTQAGRLPPGASKESSSPAAIACGARSLATAAAIAERSLLSAVAVGSLVGARQRQELRDEPLEPARPLLSIGESGAPLLAGSAAETAHKIEMGKQDGEGRAHLVRGITREPPDRCEGLAQSFEQDVEGFDQW